MSDLEDSLMESILSALSEKIDIKVLQKINTRAMRKKLLKVFTNELIYKLLSEKRVDLAPGFGSLVVKEIKEKDKKIFDRVTKTMVLKHVRGNKVVYKPGDIVKEFL
jgi:nucleoid DNA-binding protein